MANKRKPKFHCKSNAQKKAIAASYARKAEKKKSSHVGEVHKGVTKYIDVETKATRNYVIVKEQNDKVTVAKLKSIKKFDENNKNADKALVEINHERYGLPKRTGVDFQRFDKNRMSHNNLSLKDTDVFPEGKPQFKLGSHDLSRALRHTKIKK